MLKFGYDIVMSQLYAMSTLYHVEAMIATSGSPKFLISAQKVSISRSNKWAGCDLALRVIHDLCDHDHYILTSSSIASYQ